MASRRTRSASPLGNLQRRSTPSTPARKQRWDTPQRAASVTSDRRCTPASSAKQQAPPRFAFASPQNQVRGKPPVAPRTLDGIRLRQARTAQDRADSPGSHSSCAPSLSDAASAAMLVSTQNIGDSDFSNFTADEWSIATSPWKLETMRRRVASTRREAASLNEELSDAAAKRNELETRMALNRWRIRELREQEAAFTEAVSAADETAIASSSSRSQVAADQVAMNTQCTALRAEMDVLTQEITAAATLQMARCHAIRRLRTVARLAVLRRSARVKVESRRQLRVECRSQALETAAASEDAAAFRARARGLRSELAAAESDNTRRSSAAGLAPKGLRFAEERVSALKSELEAEQTRAQASVIEDETSEQEQATTQRKSAELSLRLSSAQANGRLLANALANAERQREGLSSELLEVRRQIESIRASAEPDTSTRRMLEKELQQQRDATQAWQKYADELMSGHHMISLEAAEAANACRMTMGMPWIDFGDAGEKAAAANAYHSQRWARLAG